MQTKLLLLSFGAYHLGRTLAQQCNTDLGLQESILTCIEAIPTYTLTYTDSAAAITFGCTYARSVIGCYSSICNGAYPTQASAALAESSEYCNGVAPSNTVPTATTTAETGSGASSTAAPAGSDSQSNGSSATSAAGLASQTSQAKAPGAHTRLTEEVFVVAIAGLVGGLVA